jgi:phage-related minor tail protein
MGEDAGETQGAVKDLGGELGGLVAGAGAGMGIGAIFEKAMDISNLDTTIDISMEIPEESKQAVKDAITTVGGYIEDNETALEGVRKQFQLNADLTDAENQKIVASAGTISRAYAEVDFSELIQESYEMGKSMNMTQQDALGMTKTLLDMGFPPEQLDIITEYGSQLSRAGYTAEEIQGIFASGIETGSWNIDNLMDGLKEGRILLAEMGAEVPKAVADSLKGTEISKKQVQEWGTAMAEGGEKGKQAMMDVAIALSGVKDETKRNELGTKFFGTMWEEQGKKITETIIGAKDNVGDLSENQKMLNEDVAKLDASPQQQLNQAISDLWTVLQPVMVSVANFVTKIAEWIQQNPQLSATIIAIVSVIGILMGIMMGLAPIITAVVGVMGAFGLTLGAITAPIWITIAVIVALIAIIVALWKNWDEVSTWWKKGVDKINKAIEEWAEGVKRRFRENIQEAKDMVAKINKAFEDWKNGVRERFNKAIEDVKKMWNGLTSWFDGIDLTQIGKDIIQGLINGIGSMARKVKEKAQDVANGIGETVKKILRLGSPSKVMIGMGQDTGEGLAIGLFEKIGKVAEMGKRLAQSVSKTIESGLEGFTTDDVALTNYFEAIREDGDWLNDWLTHMPKHMSDVARQMGKIIAPELERKELGAVTEATKFAKQLTVNLNSPKALDIREASREFNKTLNKMSLMW